MYQSDRGNYRTNESVAKQFRHSCLGRIIILAVILLVLFIIALMTKPGKKSMMEESMDNIQQCVEDSLRGSDWIDDVVNNIGYTFTHADGEMNAEVKKAFDDLNELKFYRHSFFNTVFVHNNLHPSGERVGIGIFGMTISTVSYSDLLLNVGPMRKDYNKAILKINQDFDLGENPNVTEFHYRRNPED